MNSRYDYLQNPEDRRHVALFRSGASVTVVTALMFVAAFVPQGRPGDTVAVELSPAAVVAPDSRTGAPSAAATGLKSDDEFSSFDEMHPHAYMGQAGVQG